MQHPPRLAVLGLVGVLFCGPSLPRSRAEEPVRLRESFAPGYGYHVSTRVELAGSLSLPPDKEHPNPKPLAVTGTSAIEYDERILDLERDGRVRKTARLYRRIDFDRSVGDRPQHNTIRPAVRRLILLRLKQVEVPFSPDGPLTWGEIDLVRTDVFTPALAGLLPDQPVRPGDRWTASDAAIQELTDLERIEEGKVECRLEQITLVEQRRHARVAFTGTVRGVNEDGPNRQRLDGYCFFDLESNHLSYVYLKGENFLLDRDGKTLGRIEGRFVLTRQAPQRRPDLTDEALKGVALEPNADNTLLLYDNPELGARFLYPRRWRVGGVRGRQVAVDEAGGSGVLVTLEPPERVPTGAQFQAEVQDWLRRQKARVLRSEGPTRVAGAANMERFWIETELAGQRVVMTYYVTRQAAAGATLAARLLPADLANVQAELERIARSLTVTRAVK
jgi:hypothetical protein